MSDFLLYLIENAHTYTDDELREGIIFYAWRSEHNPTNDKWFQAFQLLLDEQARRVRER